MRKMTLAMCIAAAAAVPASAQLVRDSSSLPAYEPGPEARNGYTAEDLMDAEIRSVNGETIGDIDDMVIGPEGQIRRLLVDVNEGLFGTGGRRLAVRWTDVHPGPREDGSVAYFVAPVSRDNLQLYGVFSNRPAAVEGTMREWRAGELLGDYVGLEYTTDYGSVVDLVFDKQGQLLSIVLEPDVSTYPPTTRIYSGYAGSDPGWDPDDDFVVLPYTTKEMREMIPE